MIARYQVVGAIDQTAAEQLEGASKTVVDDTIFVADGGIKQSSAGAEYNQSRIGHHTYLTSIRMIAWRGEGLRIRRCHQHVAFDHAPPFSPFLPTLDPRAVSLSTNVTSATSRRFLNEVLGSQSRSREGQNGSGTGCDDPKPATDGEHASADLEGWQATLKDSGAEA